MFDFHWFFSLIRLDAGGQRQRSCERSPLMFLYIGQADRFVITAARTSGTFDFLQHVII